MYDCSFFSPPVLPHNTPWDRDLNKQNILFPKMLFRQRNRIKNAFYIFHPPVWSHPNTRNHNLYHLISTLPKDKTTQLTILFSGMVFEEIFNFFSLYIFQCKMLNPIVAHLYARDYDFNKFKSTLPKNACVQVLDFLTKQCLKKKRFVLRNANKFLISV